MEIVRTVVSLVVLFVVVILICRVVGLRTFSKISAVDFAMTTALGNILGSAIVNPKPSILLAGLDAPNLDFERQIARHPVLVTNGGVSSIFSGCVFTRVEEPAGRVFWKSRSIRVRKLRICRCPGFGFRPFPISALAKIRNERPLWPCVADRRSASYLP